MTDAPPQLLPSGMEGRRCNAGDFHLSGFKTCEKTHLTVS
jgi:hypothetical protein